MKKAIALSLLLTLAAGAGYLYRQYREAARAAEFDEPKDLTGAEVREGLASEDPRDRLEALAQIEQLAPADRRLALVDALGSPHPATRLTAVAALAGSFPRDPAVIDAVLGTAKDDPDADVRQASFDALTKSGDSRVLDLAAASLLEAEAGLPVRLAAARALDGLTGRDTSRELAVALEQAETVADELGMEWEDWLGERRGRLTFDPQSGHFR